MVQPPALGFRPPDAPASPRALRRTNSKAKAPRPPAITLRSLAGWCRPSTQVRGGGQVNAGIPVGRNAGEYLLNGRVSESPATNGRSHDELPWG
jgi:hypothetical protein